MKLIRKRKLKWREREFLSRLSHLFILLFTFLLLYYLTHPNFVVNGISKAFYATMERELFPKIAIGLKPPHFNPYLEQNNTQNPSSISFQPSSDSQSHLKHKDILFCSWYCNQFTLETIMNMLDKDNVVSIHKTDAFLEYGAIVPNKNTQFRSICALRISAFCQSKFIAESVDLVYAVAPIYAINQNKLPMMYQHHQNFKSYLNSIGLNVIVVEGVFPKQKQKYKVTSPGNEPLEIQVTLTDNFYIRENLLNVAANKVKEWEYLLWIDAHQIFSNNYWWEETIHKLEHYAAVQLFQDLVHLQQKDNKTDESRHFPGSMYVYSHTELIETFVDRYHIWIGNAWGVRREIYRKIGSILDYCISGCCDCAYNIAALKNVSHWNILDNWPHYKSVLMPWINHAASIFQGKSSVVRGRIHHLWHERFFNYEKMMKAMAHGNFDPEQDIERDENGIIVLKSQYLKELFAEG